MKTSRTNPLYIWQELLHQWSHQSSEIKNSNSFISDQSITQNGSMVIADNSLATFKSGLQGHPFPKSNDVGVKIGYWTKKFTSKPYVPGIDRIGFSTSEHRTINTQCSELKFGNYESYDVLLRGFDLKMTNARTGAIEYVCPSDFKVEVIYTKLNATRTCIDCKFDISISGEGSQTKSKDPIEYEFKIDFTAIGGDLQMAKEHIKKSSALTDYKRVRKETVPA